MYYQVVSILSIADITTGLHAPEQIQALKTSMYECYVNYNEAWSVVSHRLKSTFTL